MELSSQGYKARLLLDSLSPDGVRLTTMELTYPRMVHAELLTHRSLSKNSSSSRAIVLKKMLETVKENPVLPVWWGKNQAGMQAKEDIGWAKIEEAKKIWLEGRDAAVECAGKLGDLGLHKQLVNRLLEPYSWITIILSATDWSNFFALRCHPDAQPELEKIVRMAQQLRQDNQPRVVNFGDWHLPLVHDLSGQLIFAEDAQDIAKLSQDFNMPEMEIWKRISAGRCCRVSYLSHNGKRDLAADLLLCNKLIEDGHYSPLEHMATPITTEDLDESVQEYSNERYCSKLRAEARSGNFVGWKQFRKEIPFEYDFSLKKNQLAKASKIPTNKE